MNPFDILGSLMNSRMGPSAGRLERTFGNGGFGAPGGMTGAGMPGGGPGGLFDMLGKVAGSMLGGSASGAPGAPRTGGSGGFSPADILG